MTQKTEIKESALPTLVLASGNAGKIREFQAMFAPLGVRVAGQKEYRPIAHNSTNQKF